MTGPAQLALFAAAAVAPQVDPAGPSTPALFERARRLALADPYLLLADDLPAALAARLTSSGGGAPGWPLHEFDRGGCTFYRHPTAPETVARFTYAELAASIRPTAAHVEEARTYAEARRSMIEDEHSDPAGARPSEWARLWPVAVWRLEGLPGIGAHLARLAELRGEPAPLTLF